METTNKRECFEDDFSKDVQLYTEVIKEYFREIQNFADINISKLQKDLLSNLYSSCNEEFILNVKKTTPEEIEIQITRENKQGLLIKINKNE